MPYTLFGSVWDLLDQHLSSNPVHPQHVKHEILAQHQNKPIPTAIRRSDVLWNRPLGPDPSTAPRPRRLREEIPVIKNEDDDGKSVGGKKSPYAIKTHMKGLTVRGRLVNHFGSPKGKLRGRSIGKSHASVSPSVTAHKKRQRSHRSTSKGNNSHSPHHSKQHHRSRSVRKHKRHRHGKGKASIENHEPIPVWEKEGIERTIYHPGSNQHVLRLDANLNPIGVKLESGGGTGSGSKKSIENPVVKVIHDNANNSTSAMGSRPPILPEPVPKKQPIPHRETGRDRMMKWVAQNQDAIEKKKTEKLNDLKKRIEKVRDAKAKKLNDVHKELHKDGKKTETSSLEIQSPSGKTTKKTKNKHHKKKTGFPGDDDEDGDEDDEEENEGEDDSAEAKDSDEALAEKQKENCDNLEKENTPFLFQEGGKPDPAGKTMDDTVAVANKRAPISEVWKFFNTSKKDDKATVEQALDEKLKELEGEEFMCRPRFENALKDLHKIINDMKACDLGGKSVEEASNFPMEVLNVSKDHEWEEIERASPKNFIRKYAYEHQCSNGYSHNPNWEKAALMAWEMVVKDKKCFELLGKGTEDAEVVFSPVAMDSDFKDIGNRYGKLRREMVKIGCMPMDMEKLREFFEEMMEGKDFYHYAHYAGEHLAHIHRKAEEEINPLIEELIQSGALTAKNGDDLSRGMFANTSFSGVGKKHMKKIGRRNSIGKGKGVCLAKGMDGILDVDGKCKKIKTKNNKTKSNKDGTQSSFADDDEEEDVATDDEVADDNEADDDTGGGGRTAQPPEEGTDPGIGPKHFFLDMVRLLNNLEKPLDQGLITEFEQRKAIQAVIDPLRARIREVLEMVRIGAVSVRNDYLDERAEDWHQMAVEEQDKGEIPPPPGDGMEVELPPPPPEAEADDAAIDAEGGEGGEGGEDAGAEGGEEGAEGGEEGGDAEDAGDVGENEAADDASGFLEKGRNKMKQLLTGGNKTKNSTTTTVGKNNDAKQMFGQHAKHASALIASASGGCGTARKMIPTELTAKQRVELARIMERQRTRMKNELISVKKLGLNRYDLETLVGKGIKTVKKEHAMNAATAGAGSVDQHVGVVNKKPKKVRLHKSTSGTELSPSKSSFAKGGKGKPEPLDPTNPKKKKPPPDEEEDEGEDEDEADEDEGEEDEEEEEDDLEGDRAPNNDRGKGKVITTADPAKKAAKDTGTTENNVESIENAIASDKASLAFQADYLRAKKARPSLTEEQYLNENKEKRERARGDEVQIVRMDAPPAGKTKGKSIVVEDEDEEGEGGEDEEEGEGAEGGKGQGKKKKKYPGSAKKKEDEDDDPDGEDEEDDEDEDEEVISKGKGKGKKGKGKGNVDDENEDEENEETTKGKGKGNKGKGKKGKGKGEDEEMDWLNEEHEDNLFDDEDENETAHPQPYDPPRKTGEKKAYTEQMWRDEIADPDHLAKNDPELDYELKKQYNELKPADPVEDEEPLEKLNEFLEDGTEKDQARKQFDEAEEVLEKCDSTENMTYNKAVELIEKQIRKAAEMKDEKNLEYWEKRRDQFEEEFNAKMEREENQDWQKIENEQKVLLGVGGVFISLWVWAVRLHFFLYVFYPFHNLFPLHTRTSCIRFISPTTKSTTSTEKTSLYTHPL